MGQCGNGILGRQDNAPSINPLLHRPNTPLRVPVSDKATSQLRTEFMRRWRSGEPRAKAWREAQLSLLQSKEFSNPYFWAAFTLTGQWR